VSSPPNFLGGKERDHLKRDRVKGGKKKEGGRPEERGKVKTKLDSHHREPSIRNSQRSRRCRQRRVRGTKQREKEKFKRGNKS